MPEKLTDHSAENLKQLRAQTRMSRREVLHLLHDLGIDMHETTLRRIEEGIQPMKVPEAVAFSQVFGTTVEELATGGADPIGAEIRAKISEAKAERRELGKHEGAWLSLCYNLGEGLDRDTDSPAVEEAREYLAATREERDARSSIGPSDVPR